MMRSWPWIAPVAFAGVATTAIDLWRATGPAHPAEPSNRPLAVAAGEFVTSDSCRACHPGNHASWHASFHRTMTRVARLEDILPEMDGLELALDGIDHRAERRGDAIFVTTSQPGPDGRAATSAPRELVLLTGSHHQQNFWLESGEGRGLEPFPFGWLVAERRWAPLTDTFLCPPDIRRGRAEGVWNTSCLNCHVTQGRARPDPSGLFDSEVAEFGIACESCHGPARAHVDLHRNPLRRQLARLDDAPDPSIVNPARLDGPASALVCGQCHAVWTYDSRESLVDSALHGTRFRPGDRELPGRFVVQPAREGEADRLRELEAANPDFIGDTFWPDGMVRITGREYNGVETSPCFEGGAFSCLSCHEMHPPPGPRAELRSWAVNQLAEGGDSNRACLACHAVIGADLVAHTRHAPGSSGSRCYDCHMPHNTYGLLRAVRGHRITSPTVGETTELGRPNACNLCHLDRTLEWTAGKLTEWYAQPAPALSSDDRTIAAGARWILQGDAGARALAAWSMGWRPAQEASGRDWLAPYLAVSLNDPYAAVRHIAARSLRTLPGFEGLDFDHTADDETTFAAAAAAYQRSLELRPPRAPPSPPATLLDPDGRFRGEPYERLLDTRDHRPVYLVE